MITASRQSSRVGKIEQEKNRRIGILLSRNDREYWGMGTKKADSPVCMQTEVISLEKRFRSAS
ncbi:MAG: hypothetical protein ACLUT1_08385, partial [Ruminococcus sp.]